MLSDLKDAGISSDKHALIIPPFISRGKKVHPAPFTDSSMSGKLVEFLCILNFVSLLGMNVSYSLNSHLACIIVSSTLCLCSLCSD